MLQLELETKGRCKEGSTRQERAMGGDDNGDVVITDQRSDSERELAVFREDAKRQRQETGGPAWQSYVPDAQREWDGETGGSSF